MSLLPTAGRQSRQQPDPLADEFAKRRDLDVRYIDQLKALLTPEQFAMLPGIGRYLSAEERQGLAATTAGRRTKAGLGVGTQLRIGNDELGGTGSQKATARPAKKRPEKPPGN